MKRNKVCTVCGMRPHKLPHNLNLAELLKRLEQEIRSAVADGYDVFWTGMALGSDIWAGEIVVKLRSEFEHLQLVACLPCRNQTMSWNEKWKKRYSELLAKADEVICLQEKFTDDCMRKRNYRMVEACSRLIAVYDENPCGFGGTAQTVRYAKKLRREFVIINPSKF